MEPAICNHAVTTKSLEGGANVEECSRCHQKIQYSLDKYRSTPPVVTQLGRIGHNIVLPDPSHTLALPPLDREDLAAVRAAVTKESPKQLPPPEGEPEVRPEEAGARLKWYRQYKKPMIKDLLKLGEGGFMQKWSKYGVNTYMLSHLKGDPYYKKLIAKAGPPPPPPAPGAPKARKKPGPKPKRRNQDVALDSLPPLPPWQDTWSTTVQVKWLEVYEKLLTSATAASG